MRRCRAKVEVSGVVDGRDDVEHVCDHSRRRPGGFPGAEEEKRSEGRRQDACEDEGGKLDAVEGVDEEVRERKERGGSESSGGLYAATRGNELANPESGSTS